MKKPTKFKETEYFKELINPLKTSSNIKKITVLKGCSLGLSMTNFFPLKLNE